MKQKFGRLIAGFLTILMVLSVFSMISFADSSENGQDRGGGQTWTVELTSRTEASSSTVCRLSGGGEYSDGESATVIAYPRKGYHFIGWYSADDTAFATSLCTEQSYTFTVSADTSLVALFEVSQGSTFKLTVHGSYFVVNNGSVQSDMYTATYNAGEMMFISFRDDTKEFLYWVNESGNIVSTQRDFSFYFASDTEITSYYAQTGTSDSTAMVIFRNAYKQVLLSRSYASGQTIYYPPNNPIKNGYVFKGWYIADANGNPTSVEATEEAIYAAMAGNNSVIVVPDYVSDGEAYTVNVRYTNGTDDLKPGKTYVLGTGESKTLVAPEIEDAYFQYWTVNGTIITYDSSYTVYFTNPGTAEVEAVYGHDEPTAQPTITITETYAKQEDGKYVVSNTFHYYAPDRYTVMESGFVYSKNAGLYGSEGGAERLKLKAADVKNHISGFTANEAIYTFNIRTSNPDNVYFVKAYFILRGTDGTTVTLYSNMTAASFNSQQNPDLTIIVVNDSSSVLDADATVPADTSIKDEVIVNNVATLTIFVSDDDLSEDVTLDVSEQGKAYDVHIEGIKADNTATVVVLLEKALPAGLSAGTVKGYHDDGTAMTSAADSSLTTAESFYYDAATGDVYVAGSSFGNYTFVYPRDYFTITYEGTDENTTNTNPAGYYAGVEVTLADAVKEGYTFNGWFEGETKVEKITSDRTGNITLRADWTVNSYTITWLNDDDSVIDTTTVEYGTVPAHADATKAATAEYTYTFAGWTPEVVAVTGEATYKATFTAAKNSYTITWLNDDDSVINTTTVEYGVVPTHADASKAATAEYTYTFAGWTPEVVAVTGDTSYKATFTAAKNSYTITWLNDDDSIIDTTTVEYGVVPAHADASKAATAEYTYSFAGWTPEVVAVTGDTSYKARFTAAKNSYTITWLNDDDSVIDTTTVEYGVVPTHADASKAATAEYTYTFAGWTPEVVAVTGDTSYKATFTAAKNSYTITWLNDDDSVI
ncbi:MAG: InlB B-repeat-containing protein, partial [Clostridia bacterium]|nr:InlB B-repeat-containing protein [Clostridia bacterium]